MDFAGRCSVPLLLMVLGAKARGASSGGRRAAGGGRQGVESLVGRAGLEGAPSCLGGGGCGKSGSGGCKARAVMVSSSSGDGAGGRVPGAEVGVVAVGI